MTKVITRMSTDKLMKIAEVIKKSSVIRSASKSSKSSGHFRHLPSWKSKVKCVARSNNPRYLIIWSKWKIKGVLTRGKKVPASIIRCGSLDFIKLLECMETCSCHFNMEIIGYIASLLVGLSWDWSEGRIDPDRADPDLSFFHIEPWRLHPIRCLLWVVHLY